MKSIRTAKNIFRVTVNYNQSVEEMVEAGKYDCFNSDITSKNFPTKRKGTTEVVVKLIHFNRVLADGDEAVHELDRIGYRPAELHEHLAFGEQHPEVQREFPIVALGSVLQARCHFRNVPVLYGSDSVRRLYLCWFGRSWIALWRFAAVSK